MLVLGPACYPQAPVVSSPVMPLGRVASIRGPHRRALVQAYTCRGSCMPWKDVRRPHNISIGTWCMCTDSMLANRPLPLAGCQTG